MPWKGETMMNSERTIQASAARRKLGGDTRASGAPPADSPPPGGNTGGRESPAGPESPRHEVSIHWLTMTSTASASDSAIAVLDRIFGREREVGKGGRFYLGSWRWAAGCSVWMEHVSARRGVDSCMVDVPGAVLDTLEPAQRVELLVALLSRGFRATRIDCAMDVRDGVWSQLQDRVRAAFKRGELCGARCVQGYDDLRLDGNDAQGTYIGKRGKEGSGRLSNIYDKGLESGTTDKAGEWVRWEVRFSGDCAAEVAMLIGREPERAAMTMAGVILGSVDFRAVNGQTALCRRPRLAWWRKILEDVEGVRVVAKRVSSSWEGWARWMREQVAPGLARLAGVQRIEDLGRDGAALIGVMAAAGIHGVEAGKYGAVAWGFDRWRGVT